MYRWAVVISLLALAAHPRESAAQSPPYQCGPDCTTPGRYVLCNDNFDTAMVSTGGIVLERTLEAACASFSPPAANFEVTGFIALFGAGDTLFSLLEIFDENGTTMAGTSRFDTGAEIPFSTDPGFSGLFFSSLALTSTFRMCIRQQLDIEDTRPVLFDSDGAQARNTTFTIGQGWQDATNADFIIRPLVEYDDLTPWAPGGPCDHQNPGDGGVRDAGARDAADPGDGGPDTKPPPTISAISPNEGLNTTPVEVVVSGSGFVSGLTLKIGTIAAGEVVVPGATTITAVVPANIAKGTYDVVVTNPDGQAAILPEGYTVLSDDAQTTVADQCGCRAAASPRATSTLGAIILLGLLYTRRRPSTEQPSIDPRSTDRTSSWHDLARNVRRQPPSAGPPGIRRVESSDRR